MTTRWNGATAGICGGTIPDLLRLVYRRALEPFRVNSFIIRPLWRSLGLEKTMHRCHMSGAD
jgi:hypothetical protein